MVTFGSDGVLFLMRGEEEKEEEAMYCMTRLGEIDVIDATGS